MIDSKFNLDDDLSDNNGGQPEPPTHGGKPDKTVKRVSAATLKRRAAQAASPTPA